MIRVVGKEDAEGWHVMYYLPYPSEVDKYPALRTILETAGSYRGYKAEQVSSHYASGWVESMVAVEGVRLALEKVGYDNLSGRAVRDALASLKDFDTGLIPPISMSDKKPYYCDTDVVYQIRDGKHVPVSERLKPVYFLEFE